MPIRPPRHKPGVARPKVEVRKHTPTVIDKRPSARQRGYDSAWEKARKAYLAKHPLCVHCLAKGRVTLSTDVDHIIPHRGDRKLFWDSKTNWQALCIKCHSRKTAAEDGGFGNRRKT